MSLSEIKVLVKRIGQGLLAFVFIYYLFILVLKPGAISLFKQLFVKRDPPNTIYGLLDPLKFVEKPISGENIEYELNTKSGGLPTNIPDRIPVYKFKPKPFNYLAGKEAKEDAEKLGFKESDLISDLKGNIYKWKNIRTGGQLEIDINKKDLVMKTDLQSRSASFTKGNINWGGDKEYAQSLLRSFGRFDDLYNSGTSTVYLGKITQSDIEETVISEEAQIAKVDFFRSINKYKVVGPDPKKGLLSLYVRKPENDLLLNAPVIEAYYNGINPDSSASYPIISPAEAWQAVRSGLGVVTNATPRNFNHFKNYSPVRVEKILIDNIYIGYYETPEYQTFLQPIYVFEGKYTTRGSEGGSIAIYFPAILKEYTKQIEESSNLNQ